MDWEREFRPMKYFPQALQKEREHPSSCSFRYLMLRQHPQ
jgi:hypothetical protein